MVRRRGMRDQVVRPLPLGARRARLASAPRGPGRLRDRQLGVQRRAAGVRLRAHPLARLGGRCRPGALRAGPAAEPVRGSHRRAHGAGPADGVVRPAVRCVAGGAGARRRRRWSGGAGPAVCRPHLGDQRGVRARGGRDHPGAGGRGRPGRGQRPSRHHPEPRDRRGPRDRCRPPPARAALDRVRRRRRQLCRVSAPGWAHTHAQPPGRRHGRRHGGRDQADDRRRGDDLRAARRADARGAERAVSFVYGTDTVLFIGVSEAQLGTGAQGFGYLLAGLGLGGS